MIFEAFFRRNKRHSQKSLNKDGNFNILKDKKVNWQVQAIQFPRISHQSGGDAILGWPTKCKPFSCFERKYMLKENEIGRKNRRSSSSNSTILTWKWIKFYVSLFFVFVHVFSFLKIIIGDDWNRYIVIFRKISINWSFWKKKRFNCA